MQACPPLGRGALADSMTALETAETPVIPAPLDQAELDLAQLARGVLDRSLRPRTASVRRLAEGVLDLQAELKKARKKARKAEKKKPGKKKDRKLATIPGQKKS